MLNVRLSSYGCTRKVWRTREKRIIIFTRNDNQAPGSPRPSNSLVGGCGGMLPQKIFRSESLKTPLKKKSGNLMATFACFFHNKLFCWLTKQYRCRKVLERLPSIRQCRAVHGYNPFGIYKST